jgi:acyl-CoA-binding protein
MNLENLSEKELDLAFKKAYKAISETKYQFKQDTLLYFYAYYKHATKEFNIELQHLPTEGAQLVSAFKMNALFQVRHLSESDSKIKYIELAIKYIGDDFLKNK